MGNYLSVKKDHVVVNSDDIHTRTIHYYWRNYIAPKSATSKKQIVKELQINGTIVSHGSFGNVFIDSIYSNNNRHITIHYHITNESSYGVLVVIFRPFI